MDCMGLPDAKTPKGVREVEMTLWNRGELVRHREQRLRDGFPMEPTDPLLRHYERTLARSRPFPRSRVLACSAQLANERRAEQGLPLLPTELDDLTGNE